MGEVKQEDWKRAGREVARRRGERGYLRQEDAVEASGVGITTWRELENGRPPKSPALRAAICRVLDWPSNALEQLAGGDDITAPTDEVSERLRRIEAMIEELRYLLQPLVDEAARQGIPPRGGKGPRGSQR